MSLKALRAEVAAQLEAATGVTTYQVAPGGLTPPAYVIEPGEPYVQPSDTFDGHQPLVSLVITAITDSGDTDHEQDTLDDLITPLITAEDLDLVQVGKPYIAVIGDASYLAADVTVSTITRI